MSPIDPARDPGRFLTALTVVVLATLTASVTVLAALTLRAGDEVVQEVELELAGQQRRLSERVAYDVERLVGNPDDSDARVEVGEIAARLTAVRTGLLNGDRALGLDGEVPGDVRDLYGPAGLDLTERLARYEAAALAIAGNPERADPDDVATVRDEALDRKLVLDLDRVVDALRDHTHDQAARDDSLVAAGLVGLVVLSLVCVGVLALTSRRLRRQFALNRSLADEVVDSEALYRSTVDSMVDGVVVLDEDGQVLRINDAAALMLNFGLHGLPAVGQNFGDFLPQLLDGDGRPLPTARRPAIQALLRDEAVVNRLIGIEGQKERRWFRCNAVPTARAGAAQRRVVLSFTDVTAQMRLEESLVEEQRRFRMALEHAPIGIAVVAADGRFLEVNQPLCEILGRSRIELLAAHVRDIVRREELDLNLPMLVDLFEGRADTLKIERSFVRPDGEQVEVMLALAAVRATDDAEPYVIAHLVDIGDRKRAEEAQRQALEREREVVAKLTELDAAKTALVSTVSHELRTPLTSVIGYLELLADDLRDPLTGHQRELVDIAARNGERLLSMIEDLLTLSGLDAGRLTLRRSATDPRRMADTVVQSLALQAETAGVTVHRSDEGEPVEADWDPARMERVLVNLVGNAIKFTPEGGRVDVTVRSGDEGVELEVRDTGTGIAEEEQDKLFTRFFRTTAAQDAAVPGTGLGLAIAAEIVERHGGHVDLRSTLGEGTTVTVHLPLGEGGVVTTTSMSSASS